MYKAGGMTKLACGALVLLLMMIGPFLLVPALSTRASTLTSVTYSGKFNLNWNGVPADYGGPMYLTTSFTFMVTANQSIGGGELDGIANGTGTLTGSWSTNSSMYPAGCPTQVSFTGHYSILLFAYANSTAKQVNFSAYGPNDYVQINTPQPGPNCWPGVSMGGVPETYAQSSIEGIVGSCFDDEGVCWSLPSNGGTITVCATSVCAGTFQVSLTSSTTSTSTTKSTTTTASTTSSSTSTKSTTSSSTTTTHQLLHKCFHD